jgi:acetolactate synthase I/II/III large subunit
VDPSVSRPSDGAAVYYVDIDPLKSQMQMWDVPARRFAAADSKVAVEQIAAYVRDHGLVNDAAVGPRRAAAAARRRRALAEQEAAEQPKDGAITGEYLTACVRRLLEGEDALILTEVVTHSRIVAEHLRPNRPGLVLHHGGGALGWSGGAVVGAKLADRERTVVSLVGDGSFLFSVPSSALWVQRRYDTPALTVIYDNHGWAGPKFCTLPVHPEGAAAAADDFHASLEPAVDLPGVALAAGAGFGATVSDPGSCRGCSRRRSRRCRPGSPRGSPRWSASGFRVSDNWANPIAVPPHGAGWGGTANLCRILLEFIVYEMRVVQPM